MYSGTNDERLKAIKIGGKPAYSIEFYRPISFEGHRENKDWRIVGPKDAPWQPVPVSLHDLGGIFPGALSWENTQGHHTVGVEWSDYNDDGLLTISSVMTGRSKQIYTGSCSARQELVPTMQARSI